MKDLKHPETLLPRYLNEHQVADIVGLSVKTLRRMRQERRGPAYSKVGRLVRYSDQIVADWMDSQRIESSKLD